MTQDLILIAFSVLIVSFLHGYGYANKHRPRVNSTINLVDTIRRQLMVNNYDYMSSESDEPLPVYHHDTHTSVQPESKPDDLIVRQPSTNKQNFVPRVYTTLDTDDIYNDSLAEEGNTDPNRDHVISDPELEGSVSIANTKNERDMIESEEILPKTDLLYNSDDQRLKNGSEAMSRDYFDGNFTTATSTMKYKLFTAPSGLSGRRMGGKKPMRRFVREQGSEGLAIIKLDNEPFPEFRLPSGRRQYMRSDPEAELEIDMPDMSDPLVDDNKDTFGDV